MIFKVSFSPRAKNDLREAASYIAERSPIAAQAWLGYIKVSIAKLNHEPFRCPVAPEGDWLGEEVRQLLHGKGNRGIYRILFVVRKKRVYIVHIRHGSRLPATFM